MKNFLHLFLTLFIINNPETFASEAENIDKIKIIKSQRQLFTYSDGRLVKTYKIALGKNPVGQKSREGDYKTPEGLYEIISKNPKSSYYLSLKIIQGQYTNSLTLPQNASRLS